MNQPLSVTATLEIFAPAETVWSVVSDVARMSEWSPECRKILRLKSGPVGLGTKFLGVNKRGIAVWPTMSTIVRFEPDRAVAWKTRESGATWTYELEPTLRGTRVTARRDLEAFSPLTTLVAPLIGGAISHDGELVSGLGTTLKRIKATVEAVAPAS